MSWILALLILALAAAAALVAVTIVMSRRLERRSPPAGKFVELDGRRLHVVELEPADAADRDCAILLLHGANLDSGDMRLALGEILAQRYRVVIPDRPGQGYSEATGAGALKPEAQAELIGRMLREMNAPRVVVVGHSLGALIALCLAMRDEGCVAGLVLINPTSHPRPGDLTWYQRLAAVVLGRAIAWTVVMPLSFALNAAFVRRLFAPEAAPAAYAERSGLALGMTPRRFLASMSEYADLRDELARLAPRYPAIASRAIVFSGSEDPIAPTAMHARKLVDAMPAASLHVIEGAGHMAHHAHAAAMIPAIDALVALQDERRELEGRREGRNGA